MTMEDKVIAAAEKWLGYLEKKSSAHLSELTANAGSANYTIFAKQYKDRWGEDYQGQPWCAMYVSCALFDGCGKEIVPHFAYCPYGVNGFKNRGQWVTSNPKRGDVIFFKDSQGVACHVGLVVSVKNGIVTTIEGNTSSAAGVIANGGCVRKKTYDISYSRILGYGRPAYEKEVIPDMTKAEVETIVKAQLQPVQAQMQALKNAVKAEVVNAYDRANPLYTDVSQVPEWWQEEVREMIECGAIKGDGKYAISMRHDALQAAVVAYRAAVEINK